MISNEKAIVLYTLYGHKFVVPWLLYLHGLIEYPISDLVPHLLL